MSGRWWSRHLRSNDCERNPRQFTAVIWNRRERGHSFAPLWPPLLFFCWRIACLSRTISPKPLRPPRACCIRRKERMLQKSLQPWPWLWLALALFYQCCLVAKKICIPVSVTESPASLQASDSILMKLLYCNDLLRKCRLLDKVGDTENWKWCDWLCAGNGLYELLAKTGMNKVWHCAFSVVQ